MTALVPCITCAGKGHRPMPAPFVRTLAVVGVDWTATATLHEIHAQPRPKITALIQRLNRLVGWGLVERRGTGRGNALEWRRAR